MSNLINAGSINLADSNAWNLADTGGVQLSNTAQTLSTNSSVASPNFTITNGVTTDGVLIGLRRVTGTGTMTVELFDGTSVVATCTVNVSAITASEITVGGLAFFKFDATYTSTGLSTMSIRLRTSVPGTVQFRRGSTAADWVKLLRTTATATAAAADLLFPTGELTSASGGTLTTLTVTQNNTAAIAFGQVWIGMGGLLSTGVAASTAYLLQIAGDLIISPGGEYRRGTVSAPIPASSSCELAFTNATNVDRGLIGNEGTYTTYGEFKTHYRLLAADAAASATSLTLASTPVGWNNNDTVALASTTRTATQNESRTLTADVTTTAASLNTGLTSAHSGTAPTQGEVINVTRNIKTHGTSTSLQAYVNFQGTNVSTFNSEYYFLGSANTNKRGVDFTTFTTAVSQVANNCSFRDFGVSGSGVWCTGGGNALPTYNFTNNVFWAISQTSILYVTSAVGGPLTIDGNVILGNPTGGQCFGITLNRSGTVTITNNRVAGASYGLTLSGVNSTTGVITISGNVTHSNGDNGHDWTQNQGGSQNNYTVSNIVSWRNGNNGMGIGPNGQNNNHFITIDGATLFGNGGAGINFIGQCPHDWTIRNVVSNAGVTLTQPYGISISGSILSLVRFLFENCDFGVTAAHTSADLNFAVSVVVENFKFRNCRFGSATELSGQLNMGVNGMVSSARHDGLAGSHKTWSYSGTLSADSVIFSTGSPSARMTPTQAAIKYAYPVPKQMSVPNGSSGGISVKVRKSVATGGETLYNGNQPRLILKANPAAGIMADVVLATATNAANGAFQTLAGSSAAVTDFAVLEFVVDCDGTAGWINVDDWGPA